MDQTARKTTGQVLAQLRARAGVSLDEVAREGGYKGRSSVQRYFSPDYDVDYVPMDVAQKLARAFVGRGEPKIELPEVLALAGVPPGGVAQLAPADLALGNLGALRRDLPVYGTALGSEVDFESAEGAGSLKVEQAALDQSEVLGYLRRPPALEGRRDVYGVYVAGASMYPRFAEGEAIFVDPKRPPMIGDDVVVFLVEPDEHEGDRVSSVLVKRLKRRTAACFELEQFNPACTFRIKRSRVRAVHRIIPAGELLA
jgi:hypothetical protein